MFQIKTTQKAAKLVERDSLTQAIERSSFVYLGILLMYLEVLKTCTFEKSWLRGRYWEAGVRNWLRRVCLSFSFLFSLPTQQHNPAASLHARRCGCSINSRRLAARNSVGVSIRRRTVGCAHYPETLLLFEKFTRDAFSSSYAQAERTTLALAQLTACRSSQAWSKSQMISLSCSNRTPSSSSF